MMRAHLNVFAAAVVVFACVRAEAQTLGTVAASDARVTMSAGRVAAVVGGRTQLTGAATVQAAPEHSAAISLTRGGEVRACQTTVVHLSETPGGDPKLLLSLDRGALEIKRTASAGDILMTPDLRFQTASAGPLDLRVRVVFEGDTCVENRGRKAPVLLVEDSFGEMSYQVKPGQHVMFERGSLRSVMDRETTPCGCPPEEAKDKPMSLADAALSGRPGTANVAAAHLFPAAASAGLTETPSPAAVEPEKTGEDHMQIATTLTYDPNAPQPPAAAAPVTPVVPIAATPVAAAPAQKTGPLSSIGRFFRRLFVH